MEDATDDAWVHRRGDLAMALRIEGIVRTMTEIEQGRRPIGALDPMSSPMVARRIRLMVAEQRIGRRSRPPRDAAARILASANSRPSIGAAEGSVVVRCGDRARAYSVRLEQEGDRWRIVELASPETSLSAATTRASTAGRLPEDEHGIRRSSGSEGGGFFDNTAGGPELRIPPDDPAYQDLTALTGGRTEDERSEEERAEDAEEEGHEDGGDPVGVPA